MTQFKLDDKQVKNLATWKKEQEQKALDYQKNNILSDDPYYDVYKDCWDNGFPYGGAIGGGLTYSFTPTSLGTTVKITDAITKETLDLTEYDQW